MELHIILRCSFSVGEALSYSRQQNLFIDKKDREVFSSSLTIRSVLRLKVKPKNKQYNIMKNIDGIYVPHRMPIILIAHPKI